MGLEDNLRYANQTLTYVQEKVPIGASNKFSDIFESRGQSLGCVVGTRLGHWLQKKGFVEPDWATGKLEIEIIALGTEKAGCGNCGEQSAVAWVYLWKMLKVRPIDWMQITNGDHAFVLIGRKSGSDPSDPSTWGDDAVVCDPWDKSAYAANMIHVRMSHIQGSPKFGMMLNVE